MIDPNKKPVDSIKHLEDTRLTIPTSELAGEESIAVGGQPTESQYDTFRHSINRGSDPELFWLDKYRNDDEATQDPQLRVDIRSLYVHEDIDPEKLIRRLYSVRQEHRDDSQLMLFSPEEMRTEVEDELERVADFYTHHHGWKNRLIQGDSLLVMNSLLQREGMAGKVQMVYIDPPYGIKYGSNWQMKLNSRDVKDKDENVSGEPEMIKAFRDTWELGIHSYLSYLRDRFVLARELLTQSGSVFVQISDDNVHLVRSLLDEVFGSENFVSQIVYKKTSGAGSPGSLNSIASVQDYILWYAKDKPQYKFRKLCTPKVFGGEGSEAYKMIELEDGRRITIKQFELETNSEFKYENRPKGSRVFRLGDLTSQTNSSYYPIVLEGKTFLPSTTRGWRTGEEGMKKVIAANRVVATKNTLSYVLYFDDYPYIDLNSLWTDASSSVGGDKLYVVQSGLKPIQRCMLMTTDPGDLVLDPTCGSGTTAFVAEQWGRRWITIDTSRIALNIAKSRLTTALYPYYELFDKDNGNIRQGFIYKTIPHITLKSLANDLEPETETLYDQPLEDKKRVRVSGPFTVETLQSQQVLRPEDVDDRRDEAEENRLFQERIFDHLKTAGIRNGDKSQRATFHSLEAVSNPYLHAKGWYTDGDGEERLVYFHIGPKFGTVSKIAVSEAVKAFRSKARNEGASWLVLLGFSFEDSINDKDYNMGSYTVSKVRMHDDLMQDGLLKKDKNAGSFITIGEPDIEIVYDSEVACHVEIRGLDIYDPIKDDVKARSIEDIAYWEIDDNYDETQFIVREIHFCGGDKKEYAAWRKGLSGIASAKNKKRAETTLNLTLNEEVWETLYDFRSSAIERTPGRKICVRVISQFGEESSKTLTIE
ncbi:MAG TPA: site-specific DNA-methyltransferase [Candidatus Amulumruptor caecigallinarius]|uniref:Site-specific DNA-methyltransferase n=1 Tax=Candidatus Amulumruptor caecigallinarius TaxID=2109911 RepID=A0A921JIH7_9BACT|nr:site-specific DNA-methyltransferase [Candidatus Amulumruptor caecigallinarius]